jgi:hypothetical protein
MLNNPFAAKVYRDIAKCYADAGYVNEATVFSELAQEVFDEYHSANHSDAGREPNENAGKP